MGTEQWRVDIRGVPEVTVALSTTTNYLPDQHGHVQPRRMRKLK